MYILHLVVFILLNIDGVPAAIAISKISKRVPKPDDIGLIFDLSIVNTAKDKKEMLEIRIRCNGSCSLNLTNNHIMPDAGRIVGGNFGYLEVGAAETVSLIWPTVTLYNRVGFCPVVVTSTNVNKEEVRLQQILQFDTRFTTLDPDCRTLRKKKGYKDCHNPDKDYFRNCTPVNCEEKYFGHRSFYNISSEKCEEVAHCSMPYELYDKFANECIDTKNFFNDDDIQMIRQGIFENNILDLKSNTNDLNLVVNESDDDDKNKNQNKSNTVRPRQTDDDDGETGNMMPYWLKGLADGLLIVFATLGIYVLICFIIFLIVSWVSSSSSSSHSKTVCVISTPSSSVNYDMYTTSSLLSHR